MSATSGVFVSGDDALLVGSAAVSASLPPSSLPTAVPITTNRTTTPTQSHHRFQIGFLEDGGVTVRTGGGGMLWDMGLSSGMKPTRRGPLATSRRPGPRPLGAPWVGLRGAALPRE